MKKLFPILVFCCLAFINSVFAQVPNTDSMMVKIAAEKNDSARARLIWDAMGTSETDPLLDIQIAEKLLEQSHKTNDKIEEVMGLSCLGYDYRSLGDNKKSMKYNLQAMDIAAANPNREAKALVNLALGFNYEDLGDFPKARTLFSEGVDLAVKTKFDKLLSVAYMSFGEFFLSMNKVDSALMYSQSGYELSMRIGYHDYLGPLLQQLGSIHAKLGNSALAISYYDLAIKEGYKINSAKFINSSYMAMAQYYYDAKQVDSALFYAKKAIAAIENTPFSNMNIYPAKLLLDIYRHRNIDSAFKYSEIYRVSNDSLFNAKTIQQTQLMAFEENIRQQQLTDERIKSEKERRENIEYALIAIGIITFFAFFLLLSRSFITNTKIIAFFGVIALLIVFEFLNLLLHPFLDKVTNHSPLLTLLALVCIAALLVPLHHRLEKWSTNKLIEKNKAIRLAKAKRTIEKLEEKDKP